MRARLVAVTLAALLVGAACAPGSPDLGYSPTGSVPIGDQRSGSVPVSLIPQPDGGVVASGSTARPLTRVTPGGSVDESWGASLPRDCAQTAGVRAVGAGFLFACVRALPPNGLPTWQLWRVTAAGDLDPTFGGGDGTVALPEAIQGFSVAPLPGGGALGIGVEAAPLSRTSLPPVSAFVFSAAGAITSTTPITTVPPTLPEGFDGWRFAAALSPTPTGVLASQRISATLFVNGLEIGASRVQQFDASGAAVDDPSFGNSSSGNEVSDTRTVGRVELPDGRIATAMTMWSVNVETQQEQRGSVLAMASSDGSPDAGFGTGGSLPLVAADGSSVTPTALTATPDGRYLVVAAVTTTGTAFLARYDAVTGALDPTFADGGRAGVTLVSIETVAHRTGGDQLYLGGTDGQGRPAVALVWNQVTP